MRSVRSAVCSWVAIAALAASAAQGQTTAGSGTVIVLPLATHIALAGSYTTTVFVRNPNANAITIDVRYYQSDSADPAGTRCLSPALMISEPRSRIS